MCLDQTTNSKIMRIITVVAVFFMMAATSFSQSVEKNNNERFLNRFESLINRMSIIDKMEEVPEDSIKTWRKERKKLRKEYRKLYSDTFTDEQAKRYYKLKGQFNKHITTLQLEDMGETLNEAEIQSPISFANSLRAVKSTVLRGQCVTSYSVPLEKPCGVRHPAHT